MKLINEIQIGSTSVDDIRDVVLQELNPSRHWLLVFDILDSASLLKSFLPERRDTRHILITSRHRSVASVLRAEQIDLSLLEPISLLFKSASHLQEPSYSQAFELVNALGCLPLAIVQRSEGSAHMDKLIQTMMRDLIERDLQNQANLIEIPNDFGRMPQYWIQRAV